LALDRGDDGAGIGVEAILGAVVADIANDVSRDFRVVQMGFRRNFAGENDPRSPIPT
jgi:hypothetical protein